ncbi:MAG: ETX/MTX2 family pore-forming toxin [Pseudomonadota bacterium]|nr:ETX/MTX2 family pore-forming toxin [Pseudomonadota bacterium]
MSKITYDLGAAKILGSDPITVLTLNSENPTDNDQTPNISGTYTLSRTSGWSNALAVKVGVKVSGETGVPFVAEGKVELSTEVQNTYTWNGSKTETESYSFSAPLKLGPHERGKVTLTATNTKISVPYSGTGEIVFKSGRRYSRKVEGIYEGINGHSVNAKYSSEKMPARALQLTVKRIPQ